MAIPIGVFIFIAALMWAKLHEPLSAFFKWLIAMFGSAKDKMSTSATTGATEITYG